MIKLIRRDGTMVLFEIDTGMHIKEPWIYFSFDAGSEMHAELLRNYLYDLKFKEKKAIAKDCLMYLDREEISELKSKLMKKWNGARHCWKYEM